MPQQKKSDLGNEVVNNINTQDGVSNADSSASIPGIYNEHQPSERTQQRPASSRASIRSTSTRKESNNLGISWKSGTWNSKAIAVAEVAHENIGAAPENNKSNKDLSSSLSSAFLSRSVKGSAKGQVAFDAERPASSASNKVELFNNNNNQTNRSTNLTSTPDVTENLNHGNGIGIPSAEDQGQSIQPSDPNTTAKDHEEKQQARYSSWVWHSWWSKPDTRANLQSSSLSEGSEPKEKRSQFDDKVAKDSQAEITSSAKSHKGEGNSIRINRGDNNSSSDSDSSTKTSWFWRWTLQQNMQNPAMAPTPAPAANASSQTSQSNGKESHESDKSAIAAASNTIGSTEAGKKVQDGNASGWAFWSTQKSDLKAGGNAQKQVGELAVSDTPSQSNPEVAQFNEQKYYRGKTTEPTTLAKSGDEKKSTRTSSQRSQRAQHSISPTVEETSKRSMPTESSLLQPSVDNTFSSAPTPTYWQQLRTWIYGSEIYQKHVNLAIAPPKIKNALAIGIHGLIPANIVQKVIGQPTGTSIRFANMGAEAIGDWTKARGYKCNIEKVALEGEGMIADRVDTLWKLLLNWVDHIRKADYILITCHSQGVPVSVMLLSRLIEFGCLSSSARIGLCGMAGINLGPFNDFRSKLFGATAFELFEFSRQDSPISKRHLESLERILRHGVRVVYGASLDDQLVSLEVCCF